MKKNLSKFTWLAGCLLSTVVCRCSVGKELQTEALRPVCEPRWRCWRRKQLCWFFGFGVGKRVPSELERMDGWMDLNIHTVYIYIYITHICISIYIYYNSMNQFIQVVWSLATSFREMSWHVKALDRINAWSKHRSLPQVWQKQREFETKNGVFLGEMYNGYRCTRWVGTTNAWGKHPLRCSYRRGMEGLGQIGWVLLMNKRWLQDYPPEV